MHGASSAQQAGMHSLTRLVQPVHLSIRHTVVVTLAGGAGLQQTGAGAGAGQQTGAGAGAGAGQQTGAGAGSQQAGAESQQAFLPQSRPASAVEAAKKIVAAQSATEALRKLDIGFLSEKGVLFRKP